MQRILVLGGYGFFGTRICASLARNPRIHLIVAGRDVGKATALASRLGLPSGNAKALDATNPGFADDLRKLGVTSLIHTAGPFQEQDYAVAQAAIRAGCNYLDLADGRAFVTGIGALDAAARAAGVSVVSGVSSLPALSCAVVDRYRDRFSRLDTIRLGISSGAVVPGIATLRAVLGYCGQKFTALENGAWIDVHGWLDTQVHTFAEPVGPRRLGRCDVPDLDLLPARFAGVKTAAFHAGFASVMGHRFVELLARRVRDGRMKSALPFARPLARIAKWTERLISDSGAMFVTMRGVDSNGAPLALTWNLVARDNHGPNIPCGPAIALANKMAAGFVPPRGAMPCMGLLSVEEILEPLNELSIREMPPEGLQNSH